jgi:hypothetical protein
MTLRLHVTQTHAASCTDRSDHVPSGGVGTARSRHPFATTSGKKLHRAPRNPGARRAKPQASHGSITRSAGASAALGPRVFGRPSATLSPSRNSLGDEARDPHTPAHDPCAAAATTLPLTPYFVRFGAGSGARARRTRQSPPVESIAPRCPHRQPHTGILRWRKHPPARLGPRNRRARCRSCCLRSPTSPLQARARHPRSLPLLTHRPCCHRHRLRLRPGRRSRRRRPLRQNQRRHFRHWLRSFRRRRWRRRRRCLRPVRPSHPCLRLVRRSRQFPLPHLRRRSVRR